MAEPPRNLQLKAGSPDGEGVCDHCGAPMKRIWGTMYEGGRPPGSYPLGLYIVTWPPGRTDHPASFDIIVNRWEAPGRQPERVAIAIDFGLRDGAFTYAASNPAGRLEIQPELFDRLLTIPEFMASPRQAEILGYVQAIRDNDPRLADVRTWGT